MLVANPAWAEWIKVVENQKIGISFYLNLATIRKDGNSRKIWEIQDLQQPNKKGYMSLMQRLEYDCKEERFRTLFISSHTGSMGTGEILLSGSITGEWVDISPDSYSEIVLKMVCAK